MRVSDKNIKMSVNRVFALIKEAHKNIPYSILTDEEEKNLCFAYCCVLQNEEEIRPVLENLKGIVA